MMDMLMHWHRVGDGQGKQAPPPECCRKRFDHELTVQLDQAVHAERQRVVLDALGDIDAWAKGALSVCFDPELRRMVEAALRAGRDAVRRAGCICSLVDVTGMGEVGPRYVPGGDFRCGIHGDQS